MIAMNPPPAAPPTKTMLNPIIQSILPAIVLDNNAINLTGMFRQIRADSKALIYTIIFCNNGYIQVYPQKV